MGPTAWPLRIHWTPIKGGFLARTQEGETTVKVINKGYKQWHVIVNGKLRRIGTSQTWAKRLAREFL